ncbi:hypothetical protein BV898_09979 [Hypsibius exemplaris]|uniref:Uncharacterized protein n=1 Tax=Hypsibius exemplaris TaxID=2072580 RepID=A0A1W0WL82_HYPEX|nr:hypothetical protein BV898_09979 [Hypsibius exemplaris]
MPDLEFILQNIPALSGATERTSESTRPHVRVKVAVLGACRTGKTVLCGGSSPSSADPHSSSSWPGNYKATLGMELHQTVLPAAGVTLHLTLMDLSGQHRYQSLLRPLVVALADAYLFVFDLTRPDTMEHLRRDITDLVSMKTDFAGVVVGTRADLTERRRLVTREQAEEFAVGFRLPYVETSVKDKGSVAECFALIGRLCAEKQGAVGAVVGGVPPPVREQLQAPPRARKSNEAAQNPKDGGKDAKSSGSRPTEEDDEF